MFLSATPCFHHFPSHLIVWPKLSMFGPCSQVVSKSHRLDQACSPSHFIFYPHKMLPRRERTLLYGKWTTGLWRESHLEFQAVNTGFMSWRRTEREPKEVLSFMSGVGRLWPMGQIQTAEPLDPACEPRWLWQHSVTRGFSGVYLLSGKGKQWQWQWQGHSSHGRI